MLQAYNSNNKAKYQNQKQKLKNPSKSSSSHYNIFPWILFFSSLRKTHKFHGFSFTNVCLHRNIHDLSTFTFHTLHSTSWFFFFFFFWDMFLFNQIFFWLNMCSYLGIIGFSVSSFGCLIYII